MSLLLAVGFALSQSQCTHPHLIFRIDDDRDVNDIPDSLAAQQAGYATENAHYIGDTAVRSMAMSSVQMCAGKHIPGQTDPYYDCMDFADLNLNGRSYAEAIICLTGRQGCGSVTRCPTLGSSCDHQYPNGGRSGNRRTPIEWAVWNYGNNIRDLGGYGWHAWGWGLSMRPNHGTAEFGSYTCLQHGGRGRCCDGESRCGGGGGIPDTTIFEIRCAGCSHPQMTSACGDPHLNLPHGGKADFRGEHKAIYNFLSARHLSVNVMTEMADFELHPANHSRHKDVHGSFITQVHIISRTKSGKTVRVSFWADAIGPKNIGSANGTVDSEPSFFLQKMIKSEKKVDDTTLRMDYSSLHAITPEFEIVVTPQKFRLERNVVGLHHRLDVSIKRRIAEADFAVPPHGIIGQAWDGDGKAIDGEQDLFPVSGEFTTYAMAKGAIEGTPNDYKVATPFATDFKYSRFDRMSAEPRNVAKLVEQGDLTEPKEVYAGETVGATEITEQNM